MSNRIVTYSPDGRDTRIEVGPEHLFHPDAMHEIQEIEIGWNVVLRLGTGRAVEEICCSVCSQQTKPVDLAVQLYEHLRGRFFQRKVDAATLRELDAAIAPWFDRFSGGEDVCFDCSNRPVHRIH